MHDIITIGGATLDVFVKAEQEEIKHSNHVDICYHEGEKLLVKDIFFSTGGGGTNSAAAFSRLGLKTGFIGALGSDPHSKIILKALKKEKIDFLGKQKAGNSGYSIILLGKRDRTILSYKGANNSLGWKDISLSELDSPWIYLSTIIGKGFNVLERISEYGNKKGIKTAANISQYEASLGIGRLSYFLSNIDILLLNKEEAMTLCKSPNIESCSRKILEKIKEMLVITDGENPIHVYTKNGSFCFPVKKIRNPKDTTGAGDAFASGFMYGIIKKRNIRKCVNYGIKEARAVIQTIGAKEGLLKKL